MIKRILYTVMMVVVLTSCRHQQTPTGSSSAPSLALAPTFESTTKASATAFDDGDRVGVYVVKQDQTLRSEFNASDNVSFQYFAAGDSLAGVPTPMFYPDRTTGVAIFAYYPYQTGVKNAFNLPFCVTSDIPASDLCYATGDSQAPSNTPMQLSFAHKLSKVVVGVNHSANVKVKSIKSIKWLGVKDSCSINLQNGAVTVSQTHTADIVANSAFEAILPAQLLDARKLIEIDAELVDGGSQTFIFNPLADPLTLQAGKVHTFNLAIRNDNSVALVDNMVIASWTSGATSSTLESAVDNTFTMHWMLPHLDYAQTSSVVLHIRNSRTNERLPYKVSDLQLSTGHTYTAATYTFSLRTSASMPLEYPYTIDSIDFVTASGELIQGCKSIVAANIYRSGALTLGVEQDNLLMITTGTLTDWVSQSSNGTIAGGGVSNTFQIQLLEFSAYDKVKSVRLTIDGAKYTFSGITASGNVLIAPLSPFDLPDKAGNAPAVYPFVIQTVELLDASSTVVNTSYCNIEVARGGVIVFQVFKGTAFVPSSTVTAWGAATSTNEDMDFVGVVASTPVTLIYCNGAATAACTDVNKMELTVDGSVLTFTLGKMQGHRFAASLVDPVDITSSSVTGKKPTNYPYTITLIKLYDSKAELVQSLPCVIKVVGDGALTIQCMK